VTIAERHDDPGESGEESQPASSTPERTVAAMAKLVHLTVPGSGDVLAARLSGLGR